MQSIRNGWTNGVYISWYDGMIWSSRYSVKKNKWKSKRRRKENTEKCKNGDFSLCPECDGYGFQLNNFTFPFRCRSCNCSGLVDWITRIK